MDDSTDRPGAVRTTSTDDAGELRMADRPRFRVLGPLSITNGLETAVLQASRPAALLAGLLLRANTVVSADWLRCLVWGERTPANARSALHTCVLRLRRLFEKYGVGGNLIEAVPGGYRLSADADTLDLLGFRATVARARTCDEPEEAARLLRAALALWQEPLLGNVNSELLHRDEVPRLAEERLRVVEGLFDAELRLGRHREILTDAWQAVRAHPAHERLAAQLVEALYRSGRRAEALAEYRRIKEHLADELGVDPDPSLRRLELAILRGELPDEPRPAIPVAAPRSVRAGPPAGTASADPQDDPATPAPTPDGATGAGVLKILVAAGLLEERPEGRYRMHDLLRTFAQAASGTPLPVAPPGRDDRSDADAAPSRPDDSPWHPTEV